MKEKLAGSLYLIVIGLVLTAIGGLFTYLLGKSYLRAKALDEWAKVECVVLESEIRERQLGPAVPVDYSFGLLYGYDFEGQPYSSEAYDIRGNANVKDRTRIVELVNRYPVGSIQECRVNPANPAEAILKADSKAPGYSIWFPILFVVGGLGVVVKALRTLVS